MAPETASWCERVRIRVCACLCHSICGRGSRLTDLYCSCYVRVVIVCVCASGRPFHRCVCVSAWCVCSHVCAQGLLSSLLSADDKANTWYMGPTHVPDDTHPPPSPHGPAVSDVRLCPATLSNTHSLDPMQTEAENNKYMPYY